MQELLDFIDISKYSGERFDLVQAGGGNSSVKCSDGTMFIKASGIYLSEVEENYGYCVVKNVELLKIFENLSICNEQNKRTADKLASEYINKYNLTKNFRPSIETLMHSMLKKYTLHTHPIQVNTITCRKDWKETLRKLFGDEIILVDYRTPGLSLALELKEKIREKDFKIIFLQNHGLIITSDIKEEINILTEQVLTIIENYINIDMKKYKLVTELSNIMNDFVNERYIAYLSDDLYLNEQLKCTPFDSLPFCPDKMVYCGIKALYIKSTPQISIKNFIKKYIDIPKVIIYKDNLFFIAKNIKKAKEIEDVFKFHILTLSINSADNINYLSNKEIEYIGNWEAEKYRQKI